MKLEALGYTEAWAQKREELGLLDFEIGRVIAEHKERYWIQNAEGDYEGEVIGNLRYSASSRADFPAVGDWVAISPYDEGKVLIHAVLPRTTLIARQAVGKVVEQQIIASNVDAGFIMQAVDRDYNLNRIERYLSICYEAKIDPVIVLTKIDLIESAVLDQILEAIRERIRGVTVLPISNESQDGYAALRDLIEPGKTYCLLGSSGVGKSSLGNALSGRDKMKTGAISQSTHKGRHVTSHRELMVLEAGGMLIDNPGMRELGISDAETGLAMTFDEIMQLAEDCQFKDCTHVQEKGCAIIAAVEQNEIDQEAYGNFMKMQRERQHYESTQAERRQKDKDFGKMVKHFKNVKNHNRDNFRE